jgi:hypothetical protein
MLTPRLRRAFPDLLEGVFAYTARCEHALVVSGTRRLITEARAGLPSFSAAFLP